MILVLTVGLAVGIGLVLLSRIDLSGLLGPDRPGARTESNMVALKERIRLYRERWGVLPPNTTVLPELVGRSNELEDELGQPIQYAVLDNGNIELIGGIRGEKNTKVSMVGEFSITNLLGEVRAEWIVMPERRRWPPER